ncbi:MAG: ferrochelatase [Candidatus Eisenbacteria bacterium]|nr:ferrochelatase [Candidatus Eisenbacteria bacterium]
MNDTTAILLMTYGTPDGKSDVEQYLYNIFNDPDIIELPWYAAPFRSLLARKIARGRFEEVQHNYGRLPGGRSPLNELTAAQGEALVQALAGDGRFESFLGMRYWAPRTEEALARIVERGIRRILLLPMYPQYARATTGSSINDFRKAARRLGVADRIEVRAICCFPDNGPMIEAMARDIRVAARDLSADEFRATPLIFSAHGLPQSVVDRGDPYQKHVERTVAAVVSCLGGHPDVTLCYQSRVGKQEWLKPYAEDVLDALIKRKAPRVLLYPVAFVTEHSETLFELDMLYGDSLRAAGIDYRRVPALGINPGFITGLADEVRLAMAGPLLPMS